jgi:hypothetical protein
MNARIRPPEHAAVWFRQPFDKTWYFTDRSEREFRRFLCNLHAVLNPKKSPSGNDEIFPVPSMTESARLLVAERESCSTSLVSGGPVI